MSAFEYTASHCPSLATAADGDPTPAKGIVARIIARIRAILRGIGAGHGARATVSQLESLSDWQLKDMGIHRSQILYLAYGTSASWTRNGHAEH